MTDSFKLTHHTTPRFKTKTYLELPRSDKVSEARSNRPRREVELIVWMLQSICLTYVALGLTTDLAIAASLAYYLHNARSGIKRLGLIV